MTNIPDYKKRVATLVSVLQANDLSCAAFVPGPNFYFLTGLNFHLMERPTLLVISADGAVFAVIPDIERSQWQAKMPDAETCYWTDADGPDDAFFKVFSKINDRVAVEGLRMRLREVDAIRKVNLACEVVDAQELISSIRLCKDEAEIDIVEDAIAISEAALVQTLDTVSVGMSEKALKQNLMMSMLENGADGPAFDPIVLFGAASADCHGQSSSDRLLQSGDAILIDFGAAYGGYNADITRTFFAQKCDAQSRDIYETVLAANEKGREIARIGLTASDLDRSVTEVLEQSEFKNLIVHKTGHGLGIDVHEWPQILIGNNQPLQNGMLFTVEPGLYLPGKIGVRIEDDVLVTPDGCRSLTKFPRELTLIA